MIKARGLYKTYISDEGRIAAIDGIDLDIQKGEFVAVVGQSGSGKSTLMNVLGCLDKPDRGQYYLDGVSVRRLNDRQLSRIRNRTIGFVFQGFNLVPRLTALENVELPLLFGGVRTLRRREMAMDALRRVGLSDRTSHLPSQMSGGQQQRVAIARAIAACPPLILADEPTGNLDAFSGGEVVSILSSLNTEGVTVVLITHDMAIARRADRIICISDGRLQSDRPASELREDRAAL